MSEIQRYTSDFSGYHHFAANGSWCEFAESEAWHLADKTTALEAKAEEHKQQLHQANQDWLDSFIREKEYNRRDREALRHEHTAELAALRGEGEPVEERCFTCKFRQGSNCHRHAPIASFKWPAIGGKTDDSCGDWKEKPRA